MRKYIFVTGGVVSGLGKGTMAASLGRLLKARGFRVTNQKFDPYINVDPGTMSPYRHGEVFVTEDGSECDLDIGHYERFIDENLSGECNITTGKVYMSVIERERRGGYDGADVQVIPHVTDEIKCRIRQAAENAKADIAIIEIGGTVGDIESLPFLEAIRQMAFEVPRAGACFIHLTLLPFLQGSGEMKSKPTQHSVKQLLAIGIQPDIVVCRSDRDVGESIRDKIALFCNVRRESVIQNMDVDNIYDVPLMLEDEGLARLVCDKLELACAKPDLDEWRALCRRRREATHTVDIALVGKYVDMKDAYLSVAESLHHAAAWEGLRLNLSWVDAEGLERSDNMAELTAASAIIVPGGFGERGFGGMIRAASHARTQKTPFFGICLGMQAAVISFAREILSLTDANTSEFAKTTNPIIDLMPEQKNVTDLGGTIRRGGAVITLKQGSLIEGAYNASSVTERHRHRYELNPTYIPTLTQNGLIIAATSHNGEGDIRSEAIELANHPFYIGTQYHPEFISRPNRPHPLFLTFIKAAKNQPPPS